MADATQDLTLNLNGTEYKIDDLSDEAKNILNKLTIVSNDEQRVSMELEKLSFAKSGYAAALKGVIEKDESSLQEEKEESEELEEGEVGGEA